MNQEFIGALKEIVKDKGISEDLLFTTIEDALVAAYKKNYAGPTSSAQNVKVTIDRESGEIHVYSQKIVVEEVFDNVTEIGLEEAQEIKPTYDLDDVKNIPILTAIYSWTYAFESPFTADIYFIQGKGQPVKSKWRNLWKNRAEAHVLPPINTQKLE